MWQQKMQAENRCIICGDVAVVPCYCERHRDQRMKKLRDKKGEEYKAQTCSLCGTEGHNRRSCPKVEEILEDAS